MAYPLGPPLLASAKSSLQAKTSNTTTDAPRKIPVASLATAATEA